MYIIYPWKNKNYQVWNAKSMPSMSDVFDRFPFFFLSGGHTHVDEATKQSNQRVEIFSRVL